MKLLITLAAGAVALLLAAPGIQAQIIYGSFPLSSSEEVPPTGSLNTGTANMTLDMGTNTVTWTVVHTVPATAAHIHQAPAGFNGGVIVNLGVPGSPIVGASPVTAGEALAIQAGGTYVNVHSAAFPGGEIRGQVRLAWQDLGGNYGAGPPVLVGGGPLIAGSTYTQALSGAPTGALGLAWLAFAPVPVPFFGGVIHAFPFNLQVFIATNAVGGLAISGIWPTAIPPGTSATLQMLISDPPLPGGIALSNGLRLTSF
jgi:hypothetical protein